MDHQRTIDDTETQASDIPDPAYRRRVRHAIIVAARDRPYAQSATRDVTPFATTDHYSMVVAYFIDPDTGDRRWALVARVGRTVLMRDFKRRKIAMGCYRHGVRRAEDNPWMRVSSRIHAWDISDVRGVPVNT